MRNFALTLSYDGSRYRGWQKQGNTGATIQGKLEDSLTRLLSQPVEVSGAGRTDAGVHARQQTATFRAETALSCAEILDGLRSHLPEDIGAQALTEAPPRFHARLSCKGKTYLYRIWNSAAPCVFERKYVWRVPEPLDAERMRRAAAALVGTHDFAAFHTGRSKKSTVRTVDRIDISPSGEELRLLFSGDGFLYNMVRIMTGTLVEVGAGRMEPGAAAAALESRDRAQSGPTAPPQGLFLWETRYDPPVFGLDTTVNENRFHDLGVMQNA